MAEYALICVMRSLSELLMYEAEQIPGLRGRIEEIQRKIRRIQFILRIADARQEIKEGIRNWIAETGEVAYDIEDILLDAVSPRKEGRKNFTQMFKEGTALHHLEQKIKVVDEKISALESDLRIRNIKPRQRGSPDLGYSVSQRCLQQRRAYSHHPEEHFVGLDEAVEELVAILVEENTDINYQVVSITGVVGIGKTTAAKKIYHHEDVTRHFHAFAWVSVSQRWQEEDILQRILHKLEPEKKREINMMETDELAQELSEVQRRKRCLVVLDDVREMDVCNLLRYAFPNRQANIKVLLTTRNEEIARDIDAVAPCYLYRQRHLNETESWELLKKKVYRGLKIAGIRPATSQGGDGPVGENEYCSSIEDDDSASGGESFRSCLSEEEEEETMGQLETSTPEDSIQDPRNQMDMEQLGKEMVGQCGGLPLAIVLLGGLLTTKTTLSEWRTVHQNFNSYLRRGRTSPESRAVQEVLALSYYDLPCQLKPCFLHLGNFPEDSKIPTRKLYQLWAAEGFISQESGQAEEEESIMDIAERYLGELVQRCMVQAQVEEVTNRFKSCQLHDLTRELCHVKGKEQNFLKKVPQRYEPELTASPSLPIPTSMSVTRRLSIAVDYDFDSYFPPKAGKPEHRVIRSAMFFSRPGNRRNLTLALDFLCAEFKVLRVLDIERSNLGEKLSQDIGTLVHLRYLSLRGSKFYKLPSSIGKLKYLQTLDLRVPFSVRLIIPDVIWKLKNLKHLYLPPNQRDDSKLQLSSLSKLEVLKNFHTGISDYRDILKLTKLQKLAVTLTLDIVNLELFISSLVTEHKNITDSSFRIHYDFQSDRDLTVLRKIAGLPHLRKLDLGGLIKMLPEHGLFAQSLTKLILRNSRLKEDPMATLEKLPNLCSLMLRKNAFEGKEICCSGQGFPRLRILELQGLTSLECWTIEEGAMPNLHFLKIDECINLRMIPEGIKSIATLNALVIANMPDVFKLRIQKVQQEEGEDVYKVEHIPLITITDTDGSYTKQLGKQKSGNSLSGLLQNIYPSIVPKKWQN